MALVRAECSALGSLPLYDDTAASVAQIYESTTFEEVHAGILDLFPRPPADVVDVGAGSGRDAAALAKRGYRVTAVEPSAGLRLQAMTRHAGMGIEWVDDALPSLRRLDGRTYDFVLLSAVWMHIPRQVRRSAMRRLACLLRPAAVLALSYRCGPGRPDRAMFEVTTEATVALAASCGLVTIRALDVDDVLGRGARWSTVAFMRR